MKRLHGLLIIIVLLGTGLGIHVMLRSAHGGAKSLAEPNSERPRTVAATESAAADLVELRTEVAQLRKQVHAHGEQLASTTSEHLAKEDSQAVADHRDPLAAIERREEDERKHREYIVGVEVAFRKEERDPRWSAATSAAVQTAIAETGELRQVAQSVECRSTMCRVEITDDSAGKLASMLRTFAMRLGHDLPSIDISRTRDASGVATMVLYMSRHSDAVVTR